MSTIALILAILALVLVTLNAIAIENLRQQLNWRKRRLGP